MWAEKKWVEEAGQEEGEERTDFVNFNMGYNNSIIIRCDSQSLVVTIIYIKVGCVVLF